MKNIFHFPRIHIFAMLIASAVAAPGADTANPQPGGEVALAALPVFSRGVREYPTPFLAVARTPELIPPLGRVLGLQDNLGSLAGFGGFIDEATGQFGFPSDESPFSLDAPSPWASGQSGIGYGSWEILRVSFDDEKLGLVINFRHPYGRKPRAEVTDPRGDLLSDDVFEVLIDPRDAQGRSRGPVYRIVGNAAGVCRVDEDLPQLGQPHQAWKADVRYGTMVSDGWWWNQSHLWMAGVQIPFAAFGGPPANGDVWGIQCAVRYVAPKITGILSPTDSFADPSRFARVRFDRDRRVNYNLHVLDESEIKNGVFRLASMVCNRGSDPEPLTLKVHLYEGDKEIGADSEDIEAKAKENFGFPKVLSIATPLASPTERDTVGRVTVTDNKYNTVIYDQFIPYWRHAPGERDWLKTCFAKEFTFLTGPYPSHGLFDYSIDCRSLMEAIPSARYLALAVQRDGQEILVQTNPLPKDGKLSGTLSVGAMPDGANYELAAVIRGEDGQEISRQTNGFTRKVMPFETAPKPGLSDLVVPPFTPPVIRRDAVSVWGRTYQHGPDGLLESLEAADKIILAGPARFVAGGVPLPGGKTNLKQHGAGQVDYEQTFQAAGIILLVAGVLDYDGFYRFHVTMAPQAQAVAVSELHFEIPLHAENAILTESPHDWAGLEGDNCTGFLDSRPGRLWDSKTSVYHPDDRKGNMPPYIWVGDDDRGIAFSCASDQGMHNDDARPAVTLDREGDVVVMRVSLVNQPLTLSGPRQFEFALQASPFKPMLENFRLWRTFGRHDGHFGTYQRNGRFFHHGWGIGNYYPTYGRFLDLAKNKEMLDQLRPDYDVICASASSGSECGGTPEYHQFWHEWGSGLGWDRMNLGPLPDWMRALGLTDPYVAVESASNTGDSNRDYRAWWLDQIVKYCGVGGLYQDNPPYGFSYEPAVGYGYVRDDGVKEPTSHTWATRTFAQRAATLMVEDHAPNAVYVYPNLCGAAQPGRSFSRRALYGEYNNEDNLKLGAIRLWLSKQWGINLGWLYQEPSAGATYKYWRAVSSRLFLFELTDFARPDSAEVYRRWLAALDNFWLDDPTITWHPYYRNPILKSTAQTNTLVSAYTAKSRALFVISNQAQSNTVETVAFQNLDRYGAGGVKYYYDAESGEEIETQAGALRLFIPGQDYRLVLGFAAPWKFAAKDALARPDLPAQSTSDGRATVTALARQLLDRPTLQPVADGHQLYEAWLGRLVSAMQTDPNQFVYLDEKACDNVDLGDPAIRKAVLFDRKKMALLVAYYNPTESDRLLPQNARAALTAKVSYQGWAYVYDPIAGYSQWNVIDLPAHAGKLELICPDAADYGGPRRGPYGIGNMLGNISEAVAARKAEMEPLVAKAEKGTGQTK